VVRLGVTSRHSMRGALGGTRTVHRPSGGRGTRREPCVLRFQNGYIVLNTEGGPTDDKPDVQAQAPPDRAPWAAR
jgi:hypothetical protein